MPHRGRDTVSFHNFESQNFKSSVSNPKSKYVAYLSVLSHISNCQSLGRKNKHEILKTDRTAPENMSHRGRDSGGGRGNVIMIIVIHVMIILAIIIITIIYIIIEIYIYIYIYIYIHAYIYIYILW